MSPKDPRDSHHGGGPSGSNLSEDDVSKIVSDVVFFCLVTDQKKSVIKRAEIIKHCDLAKRSKNIQDEVLNRAFEQMKDVMGMSARETERKGQYILVNDLVDHNNTVLDFTEKETGQMGVTMVILALVFMNNGKISEEALFGFLKNMGLHEEDSRAKANASVAANDAEVLDMMDGLDIKKYVNEVLVSRQQYLKRERRQRDPGAEVEGGVIEAFDYSWGDRAEVELRKSDVLKFVCEIYGGCSPSVFKEQMDQVIACEPGAESALEESEES